MYIMTDLRLHTTVRCCMLHILINAPGSRLAAKPFDVRIAHNSRTILYTRTWLARVYGFDEWGVETGQV